MSRFVACDHDVLRWIFFVLIHFETHCHSYVKVYMMNYLAFQVDSCQWRHRTCLCWGGCRCLPTLLDLLRKPLSERPALVETRTYRFMLNDIHSAECHIFDINRM